MTCATIPPNTVGPLVEDDFKGKALGAILLKSQIITPEQVEEALAEQAKTGARLGEALVNLGIVSQEDVHWGLSQQKSYSFVRINNELIDDSAVAAVPAEVARRHVLLPYLLIGDELTIVIDDPTNQAAITELSEITGKNIVVSIGLTEEIEAALDVCYGKARGGTVTVEPVGDFFGAGDLDGLTSDHTGEAFVRGLLERAEGAGVEEIHFIAGPLVDLRVRSGKGLATVARIGPAWMHLVSRRLMKMSGGGSVPGGRHGGVIDPPGREGEPWRVSFVVVTGGENVVLQRMSRARAPAYGGDLEAWDDVKSGGRGLVLIAGGDGPGGGRLLAWLCGRLAGTDRMAVYLGGRRLPDNADVVSVPLESHEPVAGPGALNGAMALNPDVLFVDGLPDVGLADRLLGLSAGRRLVIVTMPVSSPGVAAEYMAETATSRTLLGESLVAAGLIDVVSGPDGEGLDIACLAPTGANVAAAIKSQAPPPEVGAAVEADIRPSLERVLEGPRKRLEISPEEYRRLTGGG